MAFFGKMKHYSVESMDELLASVGHLRPYLRVYDEKENIVCETGLIRPGEYIKTVTFNRDIENEEVLTVKVMSYEPDTYMSAGAFKLKPYVMSKK